MTRHKVGSVWFNGKRWLVQLSLTVIRCDSEVQARAYSEAVRGVPGPNFARVMGRIA